MTKAAFASNGFLVVSAQDLIRGDVVYLGPDRHWTRHLPDAQLFDRNDPEAAAQVERLALDQSAVIAASLVEVFLSQGIPRPWHFREVFRATGPSNRFLGKQADQRQQEPEHVPL
ncbi:MAG: DUF2849 domain-containing protein [Rhodobacteraceae bacterium]|nr:DUF2849 domain-containing protein [Paracoccaceae bacterium]